MRVTCHLCYISTSTPFQIFSRAMMVQETKQWNGLGFVADCVADKYNDSTDPDVIVVHSLSWYPECMYALVALPVLFK